MLSTLRRHVKVTTKMELLRTLLAKWPVAIYGCEGWTMRKDEERRIETFEMKCLRMIMQISWTEKRTNKWVLKKAGVERKLLGIVKERKMKYFGHIMRKEGSCLEKEIIQGTVPRGRGRGRPRINWMGNIKTSTGRTQEDLIRMTEDVGGTSCMMRPTLEARRAEKRTEQNIYHLL